MSGVLSDINVVAFTHFATGPLTAQFLGALGANVIKIEAPSGDRNRVIVTDVTGRFPISPYFITLNRNQRDIALDLGVAEGREVLLRLIKSADVLIENHKPGSMAKFGFDYASCQAINPRLVYASISGYDLEGPKAKELGQDLLMQALSGFASVTGSADDLPIPVGTYAIDAYTSFACVIGVLAALRHRDKTGEGQWVRTDMMSCALHMLAQEVSYVMNVDPATKRGRNGICHPDMGAPYGVYACRDGAIVISLCAPPVLAGLAEKLGLTGEIGAFTASARTMKDHRDEIAAALSRRLATMPRDEALTIVRDCGLWTAPVRTLAEAIEDEAVTASGIIREAETSDGVRHRVVIEPVNLSRSPIAFTRAAPLLGEHTEEILSELGFSEAEKADLKSKRAVMP